MMRILAAIVAGALVAGCASTAERDADETKRRRLVETNVQLAAGYLQRGQLEFAKEKLEKALAMEPTDIHANNTMALLQWRLRDYAAADAHFRRAVALDKGNGDAHNNYGVFLCERGRIDEAEGRFKRAIADPLYSTPAVANQNAGLCLSKKGERTAAEAYFREALRLNPRLAPSLAQMARISLDSNRALAARGFIQRYFQETEDSPEALLLAVRIERALGHKNEEASYALRLRAKFPDSPEARQLPKPARAGKG